MCVHACGGVNSTATSPLLPKYKYIILLRQSNMENEEDVIAEDSAYEWYAIPYYCWFCTSTCKLRNT